MTRTLKWWIAIAAVVVFFAGAAVGLFGGAVHVRQQHMMMIRHGPRVGERFQAHLQRELNLTPEQQQQIAPIIQRLGARLNSIRQETSARVAEAMNQSHEEIVPLLTPEQRERLEEMRRRHEEMMRRRGEIHPPHGPPPL